MEAGSTAAQEIVAFTLANGIAYVQAAIDKGLDVENLQVDSRFSSTAI